MIKALFDIDVILDVLEPRKEFYLDSFSVLSLCDLAKIEGWISADSHSTIHYFLRKKLDEFTSRNKIVNNLKSLSVIPVRNGTLVNGFKSQYPDFEDNLKMASAQTFHLDFIVTRNIRHFKNSPVEALTPKEFMNRYKSGKLLNEIISVPFLDLKAQHHQIYNEVDDKITDVIANATFIMGKHVKEFEERFAALHGAKYCIGTSSGTDALHLALWALGIGSGDRVIVPVNTFIATAEAVSLCGAEPVFVDCDEYYNMDVQKLRDLLNNSGIEGFRNSGIEGLRDSGIEGLKNLGIGKEKIGKSGEFTNNDSRITCIIPVHLYGQPADISEIRALAEEYGLHVVEDACQAHLAAWRMAHGAWRKVGSIGDVGAFSFYPGKNLGAYGEAGAVVTNDDKLYQKMKLIHDHGASVRYHHDVVGHNYRMEGFQGAVLSVKLKHIEKWTEKRQKNAALYTELLNDVEGVIAPEIKEGRSHSFHLYIARCRRRDELKEYLEKQGIATGLHYPIPLHLQKAYAHLGYKKGDFPVAEEFADEILSLPMYPELTEKQIQYVVERIKGFYAG